MRKIIVCTLLVFVSLFASCSTMLEKAAVNNDVEMAKQALAKGEKIEDQKFVGLTAALGKHRLSRVSSSAEIRSQI